MIRITHICMAIKELWLDVLIYVGLHSNENIFTTFLLQFSNLASNNIDNSENNFGGC